MSPCPRSCSPPCSPKMVRLSIFEVTWNEMRVGKLALMVPVMTSTEGRCVAMMTWMPAARAIWARRCTAASISLPATSIRSAISSMMTTMKGNGVRSISSSSKVGRRASGSMRVWPLGVSPWPSLALARRRDQAFVVARDVAHAQRAHGAVAILHLAHHPLQRHDRLARLGDDGREQMRDVLVDAEFQHLGVDHDEAAAIRRQAVEQRQDHGVD